MENRGELLDVAKDYESGKFRITFIVDDFNPEALDEIRGKELTITAKKKTKRKTNEQNAYVWKLLTMLADKHKTTAYELYEKYLNDKPVFFEDHNGFDIRYVTDGKIIKRVEHEHWFFLKRIDVKQGENVIGLDAYARILGLSYYNREQFSNFIDLVVQDCKDDGIEVLPPDEIERLKALVK